MGEFLSEVLKGRKVVTRGHHYPCQVLYYKVRTKELVAKVHTPWGDQVYTYDTEGYYWMETPCPLDLVYGEERSYGKVPSKRP